MVSLVCYLVCSFSRTIEFCYYVHVACLIATHSTVYKSHEQCVLVNIIHYLACDSGCKTEEVVDMSQEGGICGGACPWKFILKLEIHSVERGICPIATLYSLAAAFQYLMLL